MAAGGHSPHDILPTSAGSTHCDLGIGPFDAQCTFISRSAQCRESAFEARHQRTSRTCRAAKNAMMHCFVGPPEVH